MFDWCYERIYNELDGMINWHIYFLRHVFAIARSRLNSIIYHTHWTGTWNISVIVDSFFWKTMTLILFHRFSCMLRVCCLLVIATLIGLLVLTGDSKNLEAAEFGLNGLFSRFLPTRRPMFVRPRCLPKINFSFIKIHRSGSGTFHNVLVHVFAFSVDARPFHKSLWT